MQPAATSSVTLPSIAADATLPHRKVSVLGWSDESRSIDISSGPATYIVVAQNYNPGWVADFGKVALARVRFHGWQQGYLVPGGKAGTLTMVMQPNGAFQLLLLLGAALLIGLLCRAPPSRRRSPLGSGPARRASGSASPQCPRLTRGRGPLGPGDLPMLGVTRGWGRRPLIATTFAAFVVAELLVEVIRHHSSGRTKEPCRPPLSRFGDRIRSAVVVTSRGQPIHIVEGREGRYARERGVTPERNPSRSDLEKVGAPSCASFAGGSTFWARSVETAGVVAAHSYWDQPAVHRAHRPRRGRISSVGQYLHGDGTAAGHGSPPPYCEPRAPPGSGKAAYPEGSNRPLCENHWTLVPYLSYAQHGRPAACIKEDCSYHRELSVP